MRVIDITQPDGKKTRKLKLRSLTGKEIRNLAELGYTYLGCVPKVETATDAIDGALACVLSKEDRKFLDDCENRTIKEVWSDVLKETYGDRDEEKN